VGGRAGAMAWPEEQRGWSHLVCKAREGKIHFPCIVNVSFLVRKDINFLAKLVQTS
jgi:hypothetical protein